MFFRMKLSYIGKHKGTRCTDTANNILLHFFPLLLTSLIYFQISNAYVNPLMVLKHRSIVKLCDMLAIRQTKLSAINVPKRMFFRPYASEAMPQIKELTTPPENFFNYSMTLNILSYKRII